MSKIKVSYGKDWSSTGTSYNQLVKIDKAYQNEINMYIQANIDLLNKNFKKKGAISSEDNYTLTYLSPLTDVKNYINLTTSKFVKQWLELYDIDTSRYLDRNTIIEYV